MKLKTDRGFISGRFQIFHNGHLEYALQAKAEVDFLIVGICNPDAGNDHHDAPLPTGPEHRRRPDHNPFTYWERLLMIKGALLGVGLRDSEFEIVPCPIDTPRLIASYVPTGTLHLTRLYDKWGHKKIRILEEQGYRSKILYEDISVGKTHTTRLPIGGVGPEQALPVEEGKNVRRRLLEDDNWRDYVPAGSVRIIDELDLGAKLSKVT